MFGREPRLPVDVTFSGDISDDIPGTTSKYVESLRQRLQRSYDLAASAAKTAQARHKKGYDTTARAACLEPGDRVLVEVLAFEGKHKLADKWENDIYRVLRQPNSDIPVYTVQKEDGTGRKRTLHRNHLLPIGTLPLDSQPVPIPRPKPRSSRRLVVRKQPENEMQNDNDSSDSDSDEELVVLDSSIPPDAEGQSDTDGNSQNLDLNGDAHASEGEEEEVDVDSGEDRPVTEHSDSEADTSLPDRTAQDDAEVESDGEAGEVMERATDTRERTHSPPPVPQPRRSTRSRQRPEWMRSNEFVMAQLPHHQPEWLQKVQILKMLAADQNIQSMPDKFTDALISIVRDTS